MSTRVVIIADDLSGGVALGAEFRKSGRTVCVVGGDFPRNMSKEATPEQAGIPATLAKQTHDMPDVLIVSTDSRDDPAPLAAAKTAEVLGALAPVRPVWLIKKVDSLLRGHVGAEIAAMLTASGQRRCLIAPAAPASGRTTLNGRQCVAGIPVMEQMQQMDSNAESVSDDVLHVLARETSLAARLLPLSLIRQGASALAQAMRASHEPLLVADALTTEDLHIAVAAAAKADIRCVAGTYGIGEAVMLADAAACGVRPILTVAGSTSMRTRTQALYASSMLSCSLVTLPLDAAVLEASPESIAAACRHELLEHLAAGRHVILRTYAEIEELALLRAAACAKTWEPVRLVRYVESCLAATVRPVLDHVGGVVISGGATASAIFTDVGAHSFHIMGPEVVPASPVMRITSGPYSGLPCLIKPGSFGEEGDLAIMIRALLCLEN